MFWAGVPHTARSAPPALLGSFFVIPYTDNTWRNTPDPARVLNSLLPKANADFIRSEIKELNNTKRSETAKAPHFTITRTSPTCSWSAARPDTTRYDNLLSSPRRLAPPSLSSPANHQGKKWIENPSLPDRAGSSSSASKTSPSTTCPGDPGSFPADRHRPSTGHLLRKIPGAKEKTRRRPALRALSPRGQALQQVPSHPRSDPPTRELIRRGENGFRICASGDRVPCE